MTIGAASRLDVVTCTQFTTGIVFGTQPIMTFDRTVQTDVQRTDEGALTIVMEQLLNNKKFHDFVAFAAPPIEAGAVEAVTLENGTIVGGTTAASPDLLCIAYGSVDTNLDSDSNGQRIVAAGIFKLSSTSGAQTWSANTYGGVPRPADQSACNAAYRTF